MKVPPDYKEAACCLNCEYFNFMYYNNCGKHNTTIEYGMICSDYETETVKMIAKDFKE